MRDMDPDLLLKRRSVRALPRMGIDLDSIKEPEGLEQFIETRRQMAIYPRRLRLHTALLSDSPEHTNHPSP